MHSANSSTVNAAEESTYLQLGQEFRRGHGGELANAGSLDCPDAFVAKRVAALRVERDFAASNGVGSRFLDRVANNQGLPERVGHDLKLRSRRVQNDLAYQFALHIVSAL